MWSLITTAPSFKNFAGMPSGPVLLLDFSLSNSLYTKSIVTGESLKAFVLLIYEYKATI